MYRGYTLADAHCDTVLRALDGIDLARGEARCQADIPKLKAGGVDLQVFAMWVDNTVSPKRSYDRLLRLLTQAVALANGAADTVAIVTGYEDFRKSLAQEKISLVLAVEGAHSLLPSVGSIDLCYHLGVRLITLCWNNTNWLASASRDAATFPYGLTPLGRRVVKRISQLGIIVDVSHASERTFWDVAEVCDGPFVASHSCARGICDHVRNLDDEQLRAIAFAKGTVGVNFLKGFLSSNGNATLETVVEHIEYILDRIGDEHVSLGSDFDGIPAGPRGLENATRYPALIDRLLERGHSEDTVGKIAGGNFLRVFREVCR